MRLSAILPLQGLVALLLSTLLASCTVVVDEGPDYRPPPRPQPSYCTREYEPVCAIRGANRQSFSNACLARRAGYRIVGDGLCRGGSSGDDGPTFCTREYAPVCARRGGSFRTFPNACEARAADWRVVGGGPCRG
jgi:hypothetical protein